jgi:hypothetical protein
MRVGVTGSRKYDNRALAWAILDRFHREYGIDLLIHGDAKGLDWLCSMWARHNNVPEKTFPVTNEDWEREGKKAGILRNVEMWDSGLIELLIGFEGEKGTTHMISLCDVYETPCLVVPDPVWAVENLPPPVVIDTPPWEDDPPPPPTKPYWRREPLPHQRWPRRNPEAAQRYLEDAVF